MVLIVLFTCSDAHATVISFHYRGKNMISKKWEGDNFICTSKKIR